MASKNDGMAELLMQLAGNAAQLIDRARANGMLAATAGKPAAPTLEAAPVQSQTEALQAIIVQQAMRIHALETELAEARKPGAGTVEAPAGTGASSESRPTAL